jgi:hypothetical protein
VSSPHRLASRRARLALTCTAAAAAFACALAATPSLASPGHNPRSNPGEPTPRVSTLDHPGQTSDGVPGLVVGPPTMINGRAINGRAITGKVQVRNETTYEVAPGITIREWDQVDGRKPIGRVRMNLMTVDLNAPNISFEYLAPKYVPKRFPVSTLGRWNNVVGAVNGDFFDISDTGAPLGVGVNRAKGQFGGPRTGWIPENMTLWFDKAGQPRLGPLSVQWSLRQQPTWQLSGINAPTVPAGQIGVFMHGWGKTSGASVTEGRKRAREVVVRRNKVVSNRNKLSSGRKIRKHEFVLIGVGKAAGQLKTLRKGTKLRLRRKMVGGTPQTAVSGDRPLLVDGVRRVINNRLAHPRTAIGIDADGRKLLLLVVDGRSSVSRGYTMVELADMMALLGAENALNLDGGGSSTMYSRLVTGEMGLINEPSDGTERRVPNGFGIVYHGDLPPIVPPVVPPPVPEPVPNPTPPPPAP